MRKRAYLRFIRAQPCIVCKGRQRTPTEAHHFGPRAFTRKTPDEQALPLCAIHHRIGRDAVHKLGRRFARHHNLDPLVEIRRLNDDYQGRLSA